MLIEAGTGSQVLLRAMSHLVTNKQHVLNFI